MKGKRGKQITKLLLILSVLICVLSPVIVQAKTQKLNRTSVTLGVGETTTLKLSGVKSSNVSWSSSNNKVVSVSKNGKIIAKKIGNSKITAKYGKNTYNCSVKVSKPKLSEKKATLYTNETLKLKVLYSAKSVKTIWSSSNKKIAVVNKKGKVVAKKSGTVTIKAKQGKKILKCKITVKNPEINISSISLKVNETISLEIRGAKLKSASSDNTKVATVTEKGVVTAIGEGKCQITLKDTKDISYKCNVTVIPTKVNTTVSPENVDITVEKDVYISETAVSLLVGQNHTLTLMEAKNKVNWSSANSNVAEINKNGLVTAKGEGTTTITASTDGKTFTCEVTVNANGEKGVTFTRGEWIQLLVEKFEVDVTQMNQEEWEYYFSDSQGNKYEKAIEIAKAYDIIPVESSEQSTPAFKPEDMATREFAAATVVRALGYSLEEVETLEFSDADKIKQKAEVNIAVKQGMFDITDNLFRPTEAVTDMDRAVIWNEIDNIVNVDISEHSNITYADNVVVNRLSEYTDYKVIDIGNNSYNVVINNFKDTSCLKKGVSVVLPGNNEFVSGIALTLTSDAILNGNGVMFTAVLPKDIADVVEKIDYAGYATTIVESAISTPEGISVKYIPPDSMTKGAVYANNLDMQNVKTENSYGGFGDHLVIDKDNNNLNKFPLGKFEVDLGDGIELDNSKLKGKFSFNLPELCAKIDMDVNEMEMEELFFQMSTGIEIEGGIYLSNEDITNTIKEKFKKPIFEVPCPVGSGFSLNVVIFLVGELDGKISVKAGIDAVQGMEYKNGNIRYLGTVTNSTVNFPEAEASGFFGPALGLNIELLSYPMIGVVGKVGFGLSVSGTYHPDMDLSCVDFTGYLALNVGLNDEEGMGKLLNDKFDFSWSYDIFSKTNSPAKFNLHIENSREVKSCTYGKGNISGKVYIKTEKNGEKIPIENAYIEVYEGNGRKDKNIYTDANGVFTTKNLMAGFYTLCVSAPGYQEYKENYGVEVGETTDVEIYLSPNEVDKDDSTGDDTTTGEKDTGDGDVGSEGEDTTGEEDTGEGDVGSEGENSTEDDTTDTGTEDDDFENRQIVDSGEFYGINWSIDTDGKLVVSGEFDENGDYKHPLGITIPFEWGPPWIALRDYENLIKSAEIRVKGVPSTEKWFFGCENLVTVDMSKLDMSQISDMSDMFRGCRSLTNLDLSGLDTSNVTNMSSMFSGCRSLTNLDLSGLDTSNVTNMSGMFSGCSSITNFDLSNFDTSNVTDMSEMFAGCSSITNFDLSNFDTSNVTDMSGMFSGCSSITDFELSNFDTSKVTNMSEMFRSCDNITSLDLSCFDISNVTYMGRMFNDTPNLKDLYFNSRKRLDLQMILSCGFTYVNYEYVCHVNTFDKVNIIYVD